MPATSSVHTVDPMGRPCELSAVVQRGRESIVTMVPLFIARYVSKVSLSQMLLNVFKKKGRMYIATHSIGFSYKRRNKKSSKEQK